jgi:hypothetical protein
MRDELEKELVELTAPMLLSKTYDRIPLKELQDG